MEATASQRVPSFDYRTPLGDWYRKASVRAKPQRLVDNIESQGKLFFPEKLLPVCSHSLFRDQGGEGAVRDVLARRLYVYLDFTTILEQLVINPVVLGIAHQEFGLKFPADMLFDANKIYCDEAYHGLFSVDLKRQVEIVSGVPAGPVGIPQFLRRLRQHQALLPPELRSLAELVFSVVSETLITSTLTEIPRDESVSSAVREVVGDHAIDERRHHAYFTRVLEVMWPQLSSRERRVLAPLFAEFIVAFLEPDRDAMRRIVWECMEDDSHVEQIVEESFPRDVVERDVREGARATLRLLQRVGVLEDPATLAAFEDRRLIVPA